MEVNLATTYLKFANLQMAAEALYKFDAQGNPNQVPGNPSGAVGDANGKKH
jgi:hypothetical protein